MSKSKKPPNYSQALKRLPQSARVGCVALAVERALDGYPETLKSNFHLDDALKTAWDFANTGECDSRENDGIADAISDELGQLERDGYTYDHGLMGISLVLGCSQPASLLAAVEYAGRVWVLGPGATPEEKASDPDGLRGPVYARLQLAIEACKASKKSPARWEPFIRALGDGAPVVVEEQDAKTPGAKKKTKKTTKKTAKKKTTKKTAKKKKKISAKKPGPKKVKSKTRTTKKKSSKRR